MLSLICSFILKTANTLFVLDEKLFAVFAVLFVIALLSGFVDVSLGVHQLPASKK